MSFLPPPLLVVLLLVLCPFSSTHQVAGAQEETGQHTPTSSSPSDAAGNGGDIKLKWKWSAREKIFATPLVISEADRRQCGFKGTSTSSLMPSSSHVIIASYDGTLTSLMSQQQQQQQQQEDVASSSSEPRVLWKVEPTTGDAKGRSLRGDPLLVKLPPSAKSTAEVVGNATNAASECVVVVTTLNGDVVAIRLQDGSVAWRYQHPSKAWAFTPAVLYPPKVTLAGGGGGLSHPLPPLVAVGLRSNRLIVLNGHNGRLLGEVDSLGAGVWGKPLLLPPTAAGGGGVGKAFGSTDETDDLVKTTTTTATGENKTQLLLQAVFGVTAEALVDSWAFTTSSSPAAVGGDGTHAVGTPSITTSIIPPPATMMMSSRRMWRYDLLPNAVHWKQRLGAWVFPDPLLWCRSTSSSANSNSSASSRECVVVFGSNDGKVRGVDLSTGLLRWATRPLQGGPISQAAVRVSPVDGRRAPSTPNTDTAAADGGGGARDQRKGEEEEVLVVITNEGKLCAVDPAAAVPSKKDATSTTAVDNNIDAPVSCIKITASSDTRRKSKPIPTNGGVTVIAKERGLVAVVGGGNNVSLVQLEWSTMDPMMATSSSQRSRVVRLSVVATMTLPDECLGALSTAAYDTVNAMLFVGCMKGQVVAFSLPVSPVVVATESPLGLGQEGRNTAAPDPTASGGAVPTSVRPKRKSPKTTKKRNPKGLTPAAAADGDVPDGDAAAIPSWLVWGCVVVTVLWIYHRRRRR